MNQAFPLSSDSEDEIDRWIDKYSTGEFVGKEEVLAGVSNALSSALTGYKYLKTKATFRRTGEVADQYVQIERGHRIVSLRFGVTHHAVERSRQSLYGQRTVSIKDAPQTISMYTANMGPKHAGWPTLVRAQWPILGSEGIAVAAAEIHAFALNTIQPYVTAHLEPEAIRHTFLFTPRRADLMPPEQTVFAIDHLLGRTDRLEEDRDLLLQRYEKGPDSYRKAIRQAHAIARAAAHAA